MILQASANLIVETKTYHTPPSLLLQLKAPAYFFWHADLRWSIRSGTHICNAVVQARRKRREKEPGAQGTGILGLGLPMELLYVTLISCIWLSWDGCGWQSRQLRRLAVTTWYETPSSLDYIMRNEGESKDDTNISTSA